MRPLPQPLENALQTGTRQPTCRVLVYDPALDGMGAVVRGEAVQTPLDLTPYVSFMSWSPDRLSFTLADPDGRFQPDFGQYRNYLKDQAIIRLVEGDARVSEDYWLNTFTGQINGQAGWVKSRRSRILEAKVTAYNRGCVQSFNRRQVTSAEYTVGTEAGVFLRDFVQAFFGLTEAEIRIPYTLGFQLLHNINQLVQVTPWEGVNGLLETVSGQAFFDGDGRLAWYSKNLNRPTDRVLPDYIRILDWEAPEATVDDINRVCLTFLSANLEEVEGPFQKLGQAAITTGFFTNKEVIPCYWSEDRRLRARNTVFRVIKSVNDNLLPVGEESYSQKDDFHGEIEVEIYMWVPLLASGLMASYIIGQMTNKDWVLVPTGGGYLPTIPIGRLASAIDLIGILMIMASLGSAQYEIYGVPFEMAYVQKQVIAEEYGLEYWEKREKKIENDFVGTFAQAKPIVVTELIWEKSLANKRRLVVADDLALELGDIIELPTRQRFCVTGLSKNIQRGQVPALVLEGFKVLTGSETGTLEL